MEKGKKKSAGGTSSSSSFVIDFSTLPRVKESMTIAQLKEECKAREIKGYSNLSKDFLIKQLTLNSICISATDEYKKVVAIKKLMEQEETNRKEEEKEEKKKQQSSLPVVVAPAYPRVVHVLHNPERCSLTESSKVSTTTGRIRKDTAQCDVCRKFGASVYCCLKCDWDICESCWKKDFTKPTVSAERLLPLKRVESSYRSGSTTSYATFSKGRSHPRSFYSDTDDLMHKRRKTSSSSYVEGGPCDENDDEDDDDDVHDEEEDDEDEDEEFHFENHIKNPSKEHLNKKKLLPYVVWKSSGYPPDRWHSYAGPAKKQFDSSWQKKEDANERARYIFFYHSDLGISVDFFKEIDYDEKRDKEGFIRLYIHPDDSEECTVASVKKEVFEYLLSEQNDHADEDQYEDKDEYYIDYYSL